MDKETALVEIGSIVNINVKKINENIPNELKQRLMESPYGKVVDYKITDGVELGIILKLKNGEKFWFFERELIANNSNVDDINQTMFYKPIVKRETFNSSSNLKDVLNPVKFAKWLKLSLNNVI